MAVQSCCFFFVSVFLVFFPSSSLGDRFLFSVLLFLMRRIFASAGVFHYTAEIPLSSFINNHITLRVSRFCTYL